VLRSAADQDRRSRVSVPGAGPARVESYDGTGELVQVRTTRATNRTPILVLAGGFTVVRR
jgi:hypothetical protein